jgi:hypothetical protein
LSWIRELKSKLLGGAPDSSLVVFGKHPAWSDHIEPGIGRIDAATAAFKKRLYNVGIKKLIDSGAWVGQPEGEILPAFDHDIIAIVDRSIIFGRMWTSSDARGRAEFPMVVVARVDGVPIRRAHEAAMPVLRDFEMLVRQQRTEQDVVAAHAKAQADIATRLAERAGRNGAVDRAEAGLPDILERFFTSPVFGEGAVGFLRILRGLEQAAVARRKGVGNPPFQARAPLSAAATNDDLIDWALLVDATLGKDSSVVVVAPVTGMWVDVIAGPQRPDEFFCLKASPAALALDSDTPYELDPALESRWRTRVADKPTTRF